MIAKLIVFVYLNNIQYINIFNEYVHKTGFKDQHRVARLEFETMQVHGKTTD